MSLSKDQLRDHLNELHAELIKGLITRLKDDENCTAADRSLAWAMLKDNGISILDLSVTDSVTEGTNPVAKLPFLTGQFEDDDAEIASG